MDIIGLRVFPHSLIGKAAIWFTELPYNYLYMGAVEGCVPSKVLPGF